jgi:hypothetical protein
MIIRCGRTAALAIPQGCELTAAMAFELDSTNLVAELAIILVVLMGWPFMLAEFAGGLLMVAITALLFQNFSVAGSRRGREDSGRQGHRR